MVIISDSGISQDFFFYLNESIKQIFLLQTLLFLFIEVWFDSILCNPCIYVMCPIFLEILLNIWNTDLAFLKYPCLLIIYSVSFQRQFWLPNFCAYYIVFFFFACLVICYWIYGTYHILYLLCDICTHIYIYICYIYKFILHINIYFMSITYNVLYLYSQTT